ncbi:MAG TPA: glycine betaine ABC transporter substrate-binding protein, partial [Myxococcales bacterium]|nr:glycine betaine ABC transporter substrate-binding protein [Myxococcales bacterium]
MRVGSKAFTESVVLGEIATRLLDHHGVPARHRRELGSTRVCWNALVQGQIDLYPE